MEFEPIAFVREYFSLLEEYEIKRTENKRVISKINFLASMHPSRRISKSLPINPSEVHTMLKRRGNIIEDAISRSTKLE